MHEIWFDSDGNKIKLKDVFCRIENYVRSGGKIYVGTDSSGSLSGKTCLYATAICIHNDKMKLANYFFARTKEIGIETQTLRHKIEKEVNYSIDIGVILAERFPDAGIEIHADVGITKKSATRKFVDHIRGWILGSGFDYKIKPNSWASSSVADWHTK